MSRSGSGALILVALAASAGLAAGNAALPVTGNRPGPRPHDELIAFQRSTGRAGSGSSIWIMDGDGQEQHEVSRTPRGASDTMPSVSLSLGEVVWQRTSHGESYIMRGDIFGDPTEQLTSMPGARQPSTSRDGAYVVFSVSSGTSCSLWMVGSDGHRLRRLTDQGGRPACDSNPVWSPDSRSIAFRHTVSRGNHTTSSQELVMAATGGTPRPLPLPRQVVAFNWAPGFDYLVVVGPTTTRALEAVAPDGKVLHTLIRSAALLGIPTWAPDEARAAFALRQRDGSSRLFSVGARGGRATQLTRTPDSSDSDPSWGYPSNQGSEPGPGVHAHSVPTGRRRR